MRGVPFPKIPAQKEGYHGQDFLCFQFHAYRLICQGLFTHHTCYIWCISTCTLDRLLKRRYKLLRTGSLWIRKKRTLIYIVGARPMVFTLNYLELFPKIIEIFWENHVSHWKFFPVFMVNFLGIPASRLKISALPASRLYPIDTHLKHRTQPSPQMKWNCSTETGRYQYLDKWTTIWYSVGAGGHFPHWIIYFKHLWGRLIFLKRQCLTHI